MDKSLRGFCQKMGQLMPRIHKEFFRTGQASASFGSMSFSQLFVLEFLRAKDSVKMKDIAKPLSITTSAATGLVDRMVKMGLLKRKPHPSDRRVINIELTQKGRSTINKIASEKEQILVNIFGKLTMRERDDYVRILEKICRILHNEKNENR